jgi:cytochrome c oxidase subunit 1/cytochrome c oxidase subunit I+III
MTTHAATLAAEQRLTALWETPHTAWGWLATVDHKKIGIRYIVTAFVFLVIGGVEALIMRAQLTANNLAVVSPDAYNQIFTMHGMTMIFWYASPILSGFGNYLIPQLIGARDMALPRLNAFTYWTFLLSGLLLYVGLPLGRMPDGGWFAYTPLTTHPYSPGIGMDLYAVSLILFTISVTAGSINFIATIFFLRAPGMSINRMPLMAYSTLTMSFLSMFSMPALVAACVFLELDRRWGTHFFDVPHGGDSMLWQHLFWFFAHPWVYIIFLPATGMISMLLPVFARRPIVGYPFVAVATILTGVVGMGVWVHHMFATGMTFVSMSLFSAASMTISIFSTVQIFAWVATLWRGRPVMTTSLLFAIGFITTFVIGGLNGVVTAVVPFDWQLHDTYFVVSHLHYVLIGANLFPVMAALYYWYPKMTGRLMNERAGRWSFWLMFAGFNAAFFPMQILGMAGMPRRLSTYPAGLGWEGWNAAISVAAVVLGIGILVTFINAMASYRRGPVAGDNPWQADTLEWDVSSPPPSYGVLSIPLVASRHPLWDEHSESDDPREERRFDHSRLTMSTSWLSARPVALSQMPEDTLAPLWLGVTVTAVLAALLVPSWRAALIFVGLSLVIAGWWLMPRPQKQVP